MKTARFHSGFTLLEMLLATVLSAVLMLAVLSVLAGVSRDRKNLAQIQPRSAASHGTIDLLRWDLANARAMQPSPDARMLMLIGHGGIDPKSLLPTDRLTRVTYRCIRDGRISFLVREQRYLDDPARPEQWTRLVAAGVTGISVTPQTVEADPADAPDNDTSLTVAEILEARQNPGPMLKVPSRVFVRVDGQAGSQAEDLWLK